MVRSCTLGIDIGTTLGFCIHSYDTKDMSNLEVGLKYNEKVKYAISEILDKGFFMVGSIDLSKVEKQGDRVSKLGFMLEQMRLSCQIDVVAYEKVYRFMSSAAAHTYGMYRGELLRIYDRDEAGTDIIELSPTDIKKAFTGSGRAVKDDIIATAQGMGVTIVNKTKTRLDDNAADAFAICYVAKHLRSSR